MRRRLVTVLLWFAEKVAPDPDPRPYTLGGPLGAQR